MTSLNSYVNIRKTVNNVNYANVNNFTEFIEEVDWVRLAAVFNTLAVYDSDN